MIERSTPIIVGDNSLLVATEICGLIEKELIKLTMHRGGLFTVPSGMLGQLAWWILSTIMDEDDFKHLQDYYSSLGLFFLSGKFGSNAMTNCTKTDVKWDSDPKLIHTYMHTKYTTTLPAAWKSKIGLINILRWKTAYSSDTFYGAGKKLKRVTRMPLAYRTKDINQFMNVTDAWIPSPLDKSGATIFKIAEDADVAGSQLDDFYKVLGSLGASKKIIKEGSPDEFNNLRMSYDILKIYDLFKDSSFDDASTKENWLNYIETRADYLSVLQFIRSLPIMDTAAGDLTNATDPQPNDVANLFCSLSNMLAAWCYQGQVAKLMSRASILLHPFFMTNLKDWAENQIIVEISALRDRLKPLDLTRMGEMTTKKLEEMPAVYHKGVPANFLVMPAWLQERFGFTAANDKDLLAKLFQNGEYKSVKSDTYGWLSKGYSKYKPISGDPTRIVIATHDEAKRATWLKELTTEATQLRTDLQAFLNSDQIVEILSKDTEEVAKRTNAYFSAVKELPGLLRVEHGPLGVSNVTAPIFADVNMLTDIEQPDSVSELMKMNIFHAVSIKDNEVKNLIDKLVFNNVTLRSSIETLSPDTFSKKVTVLDDKKQGTEFTLPIFITSVHRSKIHQKPNWLWNANYWGVVPDAWSTVSKGSPMNLFGLSSLLGYRTYDDFKLDIESKIQSLTTEEWLQLSNAPLAAKFMYIQALAHAFENIGLICVFAPGTHVSVQLPALKQFGKMKDRVIAPFEFADFKLSEKTEKLPKDSDERKAAEKAELTAHETKRAAAYDEWLKKATAVMTKDEENKINDAAAITLSNFISNCCIIGFEPKKSDIMKSTLKHRPLGAKLTLDQAIKWVNGSEPICLNQMNGVWLLPFSKMGIPGILEESELETIPFWGYETASHQLSLSDDKVNAIKVLRQGLKLVSTWTTDETVPVKGWMVNPTHMSMISIMTGKRYLKPWYSEIIPVDSQGIRIWRREAILIDDGLVSQDSRSIIPNTPFAITADLVAVATRVNKGLSIFKVIDEPDL